MRIYCIKEIATGQIIYIGSTQYTLHDRKKLHQYSYIHKPHPVHLYILANGGWDTFEFETLTEHPDISRSDLLQLEKDAIAQYAPLMNIKKNIKRTKEERNQYNREYYAIHTEKLVKQAREWSAQRVMCECGIETCKGYLPRHLKSEKHQEWMASV